MNEPYTFKNGRVFYSDRAQSLYEDYEAENRRARDELEREAAEKEDTPLTEQQVQWILKSLQCLEKRQSALEKMLMAINQTPSPFNKPFTNPNSSATTDMTMRPTLFCNTGDSNG